MIYVESRARRFLGNGASLWCHCIPTLAKGGLEVHVEAGAGVDAVIPTPSMSLKGPRSLPTAATTLPSRCARAGAVLWLERQDGTSRRPLFHQGQVLIGFLRPLGALEPIAEDAAKGVTSFSVELCRPPRARRVWTRFRHRARSADTKPSSSPRNVAEIFHADNRSRHDYSRPRIGDRRGRCRPSGHRHGSPPRRGHLRVRLAPRGEEQVQSLGGRFSSRCPSRPRTRKTRADTPRPRMESFYQRQRELLGEVVAESDVVITAAVIPAQKISSARDRGHGQGHGARLR